MIPAFLLLLYSFTAGPWGCGGTLHPPYLENLYREVEDPPELREVASLEGRRILIDPGHGGRYAGTVGVEGTKEADVNLGVALYLWGLLREAGAEVYLTRSADRDFLPPGSESLTDDLSARVALIDSLQPDIFLSLHHNATARRDPEANRIETYYPMSDPGPSRDLARSIHRRLVRNLGIPEQEIRPGNYYVLRNSDVPAILGEPSYLSHPPTEERLRLSAKQRLEATAYFFGLIDYFSRGVPRIEWLEPRSDTITVNEPVVLRAWDDGGAGLDYSSLVVTFDEEEIVPFIDYSTGRLRIHPPPDVANGTHRVWASIRNVMGNRSHRLERDFVLMRPPASMHLEYAPSPLPHAAKSQVRLVVTLRDSGGRPVLDGTEVAWSATEDCSIFRKESKTLAGRATALAFWSPDPASPDASVTVSSGDLMQSWVLSVDRSQATLVFPRVLGSSSGQPLYEVVVEAPGALLAPGVTRSDGTFTWIPDSDSSPSADSSRTSIDFSFFKPGYQPERASWPSRPKTSVPYEVHMRPLFGEPAKTRTIVVDPAGGGSDSGGLGPTGLRGAWVSLEIARALQVRLRDAGVRCRLTRTEDVGKSDLDRIRLSQQLGADLYLRIDLSGAPDTTRSVGLVHYPGSVEGARFARSIAARFELREWRLGPPRTEISEEVLPVLRDTPCPAVVFRPLRIERSSDEHSLEHAGTRAQLAHQVALGVLDYFYPRDSREGAVEIIMPDRGTTSGETEGLTRYRVDRRWLLFSGRQSRLRFDRLGEGSHLLEILPPGAASPPVSRWFAVRPGETTSLDLRF